MVRRTWFDDLFSCPRYVRHFNRAVPLRNYAIFVARVWKTSPFRMPVKLKNHCFCRKFSPANSSFITSLKQAALGHPVENDCSKATNRTYRLRIKPQRTCSKDTRAIGQGKQPCSQEPRRPGNSPLSSDPYLLHPKTADHLLTVLHVF